VNDVLHLEDGEKYVYSHESGGESKTTTKMVGYVQLMFMKNPQFMACARRFGGLTACS
jgi:hypothetical protein